MPFKINITKCVTTKMLERQNKMSDISLSLKVECAFQFFMPLLHSVYSKNLGIHNLEEFRKMEKVESQ